MSPLHGIAPLIHGGASAPTRTQLRALVREWSAMLKAEGLPPERALVVVKRFVREAIAPPLVANCRDTDTRDIGTASLLADASQWCIEAYFESAGGRNTSPNEATTGNDAEPQS